MDNCATQLTKSEMSPKAVSRFRLFQWCAFSCGCFLVSPLLLVISLFAIFYLVYPTAFSPIRRTATFVEDHEIPNIMQELSGEWVIELPDRPYVFQDGMKGWRETRFVLNEDGTSEIHNLTLAMTNTYCGYKKYPQWTKRTLTGIWEPFSRSVFDPVVGDKDYAFIIIHGEKDHTIENRLNCYCSHELLPLSIKTGQKEGDEDNDYYCSGFLQVWKVQENEKETYRLRLLEVPHYEFIGTRTGIILKRVSPCP